MKNDLKDRTKKFAVDVINYCAELPTKQAVLIISKQLIRSATSVGANYRAACCGRSRADFIAKLSIVEEEADESIYWMELLEELGYHEDGILKNLKNEARQLTAIIVASKKTARRNA